MRWVTRFVLAGAVFVLALAAYAFAEARRDPVVRRATLSLPGWPRGARPVRVALLGDIHIGTLAMEPGRLNRIVGQVDALRPDLVLIAGDFIFGHDPNGAARLGEPMVAPLRGLRAPLGVIAVPGNHDHWTGEAVVRAQLRRAGIVMLANQAVRRGPLAVGGLDDAFTGHDDVPATMTALRRLPGARLIVTHSPDVAARLPADVRLLLAGHTHCGQVVLPFWGPVENVSRYEKRYLCGVVREGAHTVVVTAGVGTSGGPFRLNAPPDIWLLTLGPDG